jgi:hypothetical protein
LPVTSSTPHRPSSDTGSDLIGWTFFEKSLGHCTVLNTDTYMGHDNILWHTLAFDYSKAKDIVVAKVSEVRRWCKKGTPPANPSQTTPPPTFNVPVPIPLQQQPETHSPFRAILHPPKSLPPVITHQYNTRTRRILSVLRAFTHNPPPTNTNTTPTRPRPRPRHPHSDPDHVSNPDPDTPEPGHNTLVLNLDSSGRPLTYSSAKRGPDKENWTLAELEEITRLILSGTLFPILHSAIPHDRLRDVVYYNPVVKQKLNPDGTIKFRVRGTAGGNLLSVPYDFSARTASLDVVTLLLHSTVSDNKNWLPIDIKDFYLGTTLPASRYEYVRIELSKLPPAAITTHNLTPFIHNNAVYFEIRKCMYGLPQAGRLSQLCLILHLKEHRYHQYPIPLASSNTNLAISCSVSWSTISASVTAHKTMLTTL